MHTITPSGDSRSTYFKTQAAPADQANIVRSMSNDELGNAPLDGAGVDANFADAAVTPFISETEKIFEDVEKECSEQLQGVKRGGSLLTAPDLSHLGPEKGRLNRLHAAYVQSPTERNLNILLGEVERYARRITRGGGGVTDFASTDTSLKVMVNVWRNLGKFDQRSEFKTWVFRIARNVEKDEWRAVKSRREAELLEWKDYDDECSGCYQGASGEPADSNFNISGGHRLSLPTGLAPDQRMVKLEPLIEMLKPEDKRLIQLVIDGYTPRELAEKFRKNAKWASNQLNRIKKELKKMAKERYPADGVAKPARSNVLVMKGRKTPPASQAA